MCPAGLALTPENPSVHAEGADISVEEFLLPDKRTELCPRVEQLRELAVHWMASELSEERNREQFAGNSPVGQRRLWESSSLLDL